MRSMLQVAARRTVSLVAALGGSVVLAFACGKGEPSSESGGDGGSPTQQSTTAPPTQATTPADAGADALVAAAPPLPAACNGSVKSAPDAGATPPAPPAVTVPAGFVLETVAQIDAARELAALPNGDLLVATSGTNVYLVPNADGDGPPGEPVVFGSINDAPVQGVAYAASTCTVIVGSHAGVYTAQYQDGQQTATFGTPITAVRIGPVAPNSDGDVHVTTSVGFANGAVYVGVGSSCNACTEVDPTRAVVLRTSLDGGSLEAGTVTTKATRIRNAIALATNPATGTLWAGGAGQDDLPEYHPFEYFDPVSLHPGVADYGWPECEEDHVAYTPDAACANTVAPLVELPAYQTIIGAAFYPVDSTGKYAFSSAYAGGIFLASHGSWHQVDDQFVDAPRVTFVAMNGDTPVIPVDWNDAGTQWTEFVSGFQLADGITRIGRPTGVAVGPQGSLFVGDDQTGLVYRIRPQ